MEMNQDLAQKLFTDGATLICKDVPEGTEFGVDMKSWNTAERFCGIKMIPPGVHYIYYSATNNLGDVAPRSGFIHYFKKQEILVKKWDDPNQELIDDKNESNENIKANLKNLDRFLGAYPYETWDQWKNLSNKITEDLIIKLLPLSGIIRAALELIGFPDPKPKEPSDGVESSDESSSQAPKRIRKSRQFTDVEKNDELLPHLAPVEGTDLRFSALPDRNYPEGASPSEITRHSLDSTYVFQQLLGQHESVSDILGELQFSFISFLIGHSLEAFEHWKKLVGIFCSCDEAITKHIDIFSEFLTVLNYQLHEIPEDFLVDIVASNNFVYKSLRTLFRTLQSNDFSGRLKTKAKRFQEILTEKFSWDFSDILDEDEEDLPVVVET